MISSDYNSILNNFYMPIELKRMEIITGLYHRIFETESSYCPVTVSDDNGVYTYPLPVVLVKHFCEIEIHPGKLIVYTFFNNNTAMNKNFSELSNWDFGVVDFDTDMLIFKNNKDDFTYLTAYISEKRGGKLRFEFTLDFDTDKNEIYEFVKLLRKNNFYC